MVTVVVVSLVVGVEVVVALVVTVVEVSLVVTVVVVVSLVVADVLVVSLVVNVRADTRAAAAAAVAAAAVPLTEAQSTYDINLRSPDLRRALASAGGIGLRLDGLELQEPAVAL